MRISWSCSVLTLFSFALSGFFPSSTLAESALQKTIIAQTDNTVTEVKELTIKPPLTKEQEEKILKIDQAYQPKVEEALENYISSSKNFESLLGTNPKTDVLRQKYKEMVEDRYTLQNLLFSRMMDFRDVMTPDQQQSLADDVSQVLGK